MGFSKPVCHSFVREGLTLIFTADHQAADHAHQEEMVDLVQPSLLLVHSREEMAALVQLSLLLVQPKVRVQIKAKTVQAKVLTVLIKAVPMPVVQTTMVVQTTSVAETTTTTVVQMATGTAVTTLAAQAMTSKQALRWLIYNSFPPIQPLSSCILQNCWLTNYSL
jgi:hypothetical protein